MTVHKLLTLNGIHRRVIKVQLADGSKNASSDKLHHCGAGNSLAASMVAIPRDAGSCTNYQQVSGAVNGNSENRFI